MMPPDLELLLEIQDLQTLRRDIASPEYRATGLAEDTADYTARLTERIAERESQLAPRVAALYRKIAVRHERVVAPVLGGVCYGCFVQVPRRRAHDPGRNEELRTCESCGRFIYYAD